jgi:hypothetical protein
MYTPITPKVSRTSYVFRTDTKHFVIWAKTQVLAMAAANRKVRKENLAKSSNFAWFPCMAPDTFYLGENVFLD